MVEILFVSKPVEAPWNDGSKTLVRDLAASMVRHRPAVLSTGGVAGGGPRGRALAWYGPAHALGAPPLAASAALLARLAVGPRVGALWHFVFQPNERTSRAAALVARARSMPTVHTVPSAPLGGRFERRLAFADRTVVLSRRTEAAALEGGVRGVVRIAPSVAPLEVPDAASTRRTRALHGVSPDAPWVVFPGDLERGEGARALVDALSLVPEMRLGLACRRKGPSSDAAARALRDRAARLGVGARIDWIGETSDIHAVLAAADVVALPSRDLGAKVDLPIVLLEAMWLARPVLVASGGAADELADGDAVAAEPPHADAIAARLRAWIDDAADRAAFGARARAAAATRFHPRRMAEAYEALYDEVLA